MRTLPAPSGPTHLTLWPGRGPTTAATIVHANRAGAGPPIPIAGLLHGNGAVGHNWGGEYWCCNGPVGFSTGDSPDDVQHHIDYFWRSGLTSNAMYERVNKACEGKLANPKPGDACDSALQDMLTSMGDFTTLKENCAPPQQPTPPPSPFYLPGPPSSERSYTHLSLSLLLSVCKLRHVAADTRRECLRDL